MTGGVDSNTASIQFRSTDRDELWPLHEGSVSKESDLFQASGTVKGKRMVTQPDGTLKSQPLDGDDVKTVSRPDRVLTWERSDNVQFSGSCRSQWSLASCSGLRCWLREKPQLKCRALGQ